MTSWKRLITKSGSEWTSHETDILQVRNLVVPWQKLFTTPVANATHMIEITNGLQSKISKKVRQIDKDYKKSILHSGDFLLHNFYSAMQRIVEVKLRIRERALEINPPTPAQVLTQLRDGSSSQQEPKPLRRSARIEANLAKLALQDCQEPRSYIATRDDGKALPSK